MHRRLCLRPSLSVPRWLLVALLVASCGGGGGGGGSPASPSTPASTPPANSGGNSGGSTTPPPSSGQPTPPAFPEVVLAFSGSALAAPVPPVVPALKQSMDVGDMVYDRARDLLLVSTRVSGTFGVIAFRPADLSVYGFIPTTSAPTVLALSDDSSQLYAGLFNEGVVEQFEMNGGTSVRRIQVAGATSGKGAFDIAVRPGAPESIAVSIGSAPLVPTFSEIAFYTVGVRQPKNYADPFGPRASQIEFFDATTLLGFDNETTAFSFSRFTVANDGLTANGSTLGNCCFSGTLGVAGGRAFLSSGLFVDPATLKSVKTIAGSTGTFYHPGTDSVVRVSIAEEMAIPDSLQFVVDEYDYGRGYLKRRFRVHESLPGIDARLGIVAEIFSAIPVGSSSIAILMGDRTTGSTGLLVYDLATIPALSARTFDVATAAQGGASALAISLPANAIAYDPAGDRLAATLVPFIGPQGNSLAVVRAADGVVERLVPLSSEPRNVSVSATGSLAYVSLPFENAVQAVDMNTGALLWKTRIQFPIPMPQGQQTTNGFTADSIAVQPDDAQTVVVAGCQSWDGCGRELGVFQNGTQVGAHTTGQALSVVSFNSAAELVALDADTTSGFMTRFAVASSTLTQTAVVTGMLDVGGSVNNKLGFGFAYGPYALADVQANRRVGRFAPGTTEFPFYDQTLLLSATQGVGYKQFLNSSMSTPSELYELVTRAVQTDGSLLYAGQSRIRITDDRFNQGFKGIMVPTGPKRFAQAFTKFADGIGVVYVITTP